MIQPPDLFSPSPGHVIFTRPPFSVPLEQRIQQATVDSGCTREMVERDYAISHVLAGIASHPRLAGTLAFKGGTALKKLFFQSYRFSEDLDFSGMEAPRGQELEDAIRQAMAAADESLRRYGPFTLELRSIALRRPHPNDQGAFEIRVKFPWDPSPIEHVRVRVKIEITHDEPVLLTPERRALSHGYDETLAVQVLAYRLEEIVAEKMRTLLQTHQRLVTRGWNRPRARDYYDLWRILRELGENLDSAQLTDLLVRKCAHRHVAFTCLDDFFTEPLVTEARKVWDRNLRAFVRDLPPCVEVLAELRALIPAFFPDLT